MVNGIIPLILFSDISLVVYRNARDLCVLILYPTTLLNSLISSSGFQWHLQDFLCIISCHLQTVTFLLLIFQFEFLISFSALIAMTRTSKTMLNNSSENGHPCKVPNLRENAFSLSPLRMMFAVGLSYMAFMLRQIPSMPTFLRGFFFPCVIKFYYSIKEIEKASDIDIRSGQKEYPLASVSNEVIYSPMNPKNVWRL